MDEIPITPRPVERFTDLLYGDALTGFRATMEHARRQLAGRTLWQINSTAEGGGVAEMLQSVLGYLLECDILVRWLTIDGHESFFEVTKRIHHLLHGSPGDHGRLGRTERRIYESALAPEADRLTYLVQPGDAVILHDPQTLGLAPALAGAGARVIWSCHIGADHPDDNTRIGWEFLQPYLASTRYQVFSRPQYAWPSLEPDQVAVIPPCIDAFSPKNQALTASTVTAILNAAAIIPANSSESAGFTRRDETAGLVTTPAQMIQDEPVPRSARVVTQISRWDPLKDHPGVLTGFCDHGPKHDDVHLVLAGPDPASIDDDPEGQQTLAQLRAARDALQPEQRRRVHIASLPMTDVDENAAIVNALQRRADVIVQKSLAEGFGLTVTEGLWKGRPTIASRVGGIQDQIKPDVSGILIEPTDLQQFGTAITALLDNQHTAASLGHAAKAHVCQEYLAPNYLDRYLRLLLGVLPHPPDATGPG